MDRYRDQLGRFATPPSRSARGAGRRLGNRRGGGGMRGAPPPPLPRPASASPTPPGTFRIRHVPLGNAPLPPDGCRRLVNSAGLTFSFTPDASRVKVELQLFLKVNNDGTYRLYEPPYARTRTPDELERWRQTRPAELNENKAMLRLLLAYVSAVFDRVDRTLSSAGLTSRSDVFCKAEHHNNLLIGDTKFTYWRRYSPPNQNWDPRIPNELAWGVSQARVTSAVSELSGRGIGDPGLWNLFASSEFNSSPRPSYLSHFYYLSHWDVVWCPRGAGTSRSPHSPRSPRSPSPPSSPQQRYMRERLESEWMDQVGLDAVLASGNYLGTEDVVSLQPLVDPIRLQSGQGVNATTMKKLLEGWPTTRRDRDGHITFTDPFSKTTLSTRDPAQRAILEEWKQRAHYNGPWPGHGPGQRSAPGTSGGIIPPPSPQSDRAPDPSIAPVFVFTVESLLTPSGPSGRSLANRLEDLVGPP